MTYYNKQTAQVTARQLKCSDEVIRPAEPGKAVWYPFKRRPNIIILMRQVHPFRATGSALWGHAVYDSAILKAEMP
jgi:hypothetical protein